MASEALIRLHDSQILAPRIALCGQDIETNHALVSAAEMGCSAREGFGMGNANRTCAGSGGAHGGDGGFSLSYNHSTECTHNNNTYFHPQEARYEGSPGGNAIHNTTLGGNGGGIVWLTAS